MMAYRLTNNADLETTIRMSGWLENATFRKARNAMPHKIRLVRRTLSHTTGVVLTAEDGAESYDAGSMRITLLGATSTRCWATTGRDK